MGRPQGARQSSRRAVMRSKTAVWGKGARQELLREVEFSHDNRSDAGGGGAGREGREDEEVSYEERVGSEGGRRKVRLRFGASGERQQGRALAGVRVDGADEPHGHERRRRGARAAAGPRRGPLRGGVVSSPGRRRRKRLGEAHEGSREGEGELSWGERGEEGVGAEAAAGGAHGRRRCGGRGIHGRLA